MDYLERTCSMEFPAGLTSGRLWTISMMDTPCRDPPPLWTPKCDAETATERSSKGAAGLHPELPRRNPTCMYHAILMGPCRHMRKPCLFELLKKYPWARWWRLRRRRRDGAQWASQGIHRCAVPCSPDLAEIDPRLADSGPNLMEIGRRRSNIDGCRSEVGPFRPKFTQSWP